MKQNLNDILARPSDKHIYLLHASPECYSHVMFSLKQLQKALTSAIKYQFQADRYFKFAEIDNILDNDSLFAEQNIIELNFKTKPTIAQENDLLKIMAKINENSYLFIMTEKLTTFSSSWCKKINEIGSIIGLSEADTTVVIQNLLQEAKLTIDNTALNLLLELNLGNIPALMQEITRLTFLCAENHKITVADIESTNNAEYNVYALSNAYLSGDLAKSNKILDNIYQEPGDAILISWMINEDVKKLLKIKARLKDGTNINTAISELRVWGDAVNNLKIASGRISYNTLLNVLDMLANLDMSIKGVQSTPPKIILQKTIETLCKK